MQFYSLTDFRLVSNVGKEGVTGRDIIDWIKTHFKQEDYITESQNQIVLVE